jgi:WD40 repeat protein
LESRRELRRIRDAHWRLLPDLKTAAILTIEEPRILIADAVTGAPLGELPADKFDLENLMLAPDGARAVLVGGKRLTAWDLRNHRLQFEIDLAQSKDEWHDPEPSWLPSFVMRRFGMPGNAHWAIVDLATGQECYQCKEDWRTDGELQCRWLSPDGRIVVEAQTEWPTTNVVWQYLVKLIPALDASKSQRGLSAETPQSNLIRWWNIRTGAELPPLYGSLYDFAISPDSRTLATHSEDGMIKLWDVPPARPWLAILTWPLLPALLAAGRSQWRRSRLGHAKEA